MSAEVLQQAFASTATVLARVSPDQMDEPTPCASWKVRDLVNHTVGGPAFFAMTAETGVAPTGGEAPDFAGGNFRTFFDQGTKRAVVAFSADGVMDKSMKGARWAGLAPAFPCVQRLASRALRTRSARSILRPGHEA
jgi:uncharacterized protein (TIGR03086 family)